MNIKYYNISKSDIDRVPCARIFRNKIDRLVQDTCKKVLTLSMTRTEFKNDEVGIIMDLNGNILGKLYGYNGSIDNTLDDYYGIMSKAAVNSLIFIHNHPNNSGLSSNDIISFLTDHSIICVVAISNNGNISYAVKQHKDFTKYMNLGMKLANYRHKKIKEGMAVTDFENWMYKNGEMLNIRFGVSRRKR